MRLITLKINTQISDDEMRMVFANAHKNWGRTSSIPKELYPKNGYCFKRSDKV